MDAKKPSLLYKVIKATVTVFYPAMEVIGTENLPDEEAKAVIRKIDSIMNRE